LSLTSIQLFISNQLLGWGAIDSPSFPENQTEK
jgi:hypothetical protein